MSWEGDRGRRSHSGSDSADARKLMDCQTVAPKCSKFSGGLCTFSDIRLDSCGVRTGMWRREASCDVAGGSRIPFQISPPWKMLSRSRSHLAVYSLEFLPIRKACKNAVVVVEFVGTLSASLRRRPAARYIYPVACCGASVPLLSFSTTLEVVPGAFSRCPFAFVFSKPCPPTL